MLIFNVPLGKRHVLVHSFFVWQGLTCPMFLMDLPKAVGVFVDFDNLGIIRAS